MTWLVEQPVRQEELADSFLRQIKDSNITVIPGAFDGLSALLARKAGFQSLYLSGAALTASRGWPDLGLLTARDIVDRLVDLVHAAKLPVLVDVDTGFGGVLNAIRTARELTDAKAAAIQMEDQMLPKKCGHLTGKLLVSAKEMAEKIFAMKRAAPSLILVARTDALAVEGRASAIARAKLYTKAGADIIFPEALRTEKDFQVFREEVDTPLLANMTEFGRTPYFTADEYQKWGYNAVIFPVTALRAAANAVGLVYQELMKTGTQKGFLNELQTRQELYETLKYFEYEAFDSEIEKSALPSVDAD